MKQVQTTLVSLTFILLTLHVRTQDHHWKFDEGTGSTASDTGDSSNPIEATLHDATWENLPAGTYAVHLDGTDGSYVSFGKDVGQFGTNDFTLSFWIQTTDNSLSLADIIGNREEAGDGNFFSARMTQEGHITVEVDEDEEGTNHIEVTSDERGLNDGEWHHIVVTRSGDTLSLYVNDRLSGKGSANGVANIDNGREFKLGRSAGDSEGERFALNASYNDVAIFNRALAQSQIRSINSTVSDPSGSDSSGCWLSSYGRGVGKPLSACRDGQDKDGALCYPTCSDGYYGVGPVCWQSCPSRYRNDGAYCAKPGSYGRGAGYTSQKKCTDQNSQGCDKSGLLYYPKCADGFSPAGCCICSPICPPGMTDIGVSCQKKSYGRGVGVPMVCASGLEENAALCYTPCNSGLSGKGPVCWGSCPDGMYQCGALCLGSKAECVSKMLDIGMKAIDGVTEIASEAEEPIGAIISAADTVKDIAGDLNYPICS